MVKSVLTNKKRFLLEEKAKEIKRECIQMVMRVKSGHLAPALSCADIMSVIFFGILNIDPKNPRGENRDRFILSAGHKCLALYTSLAKRGFFPEEALKTFLQFKSMLGGHPDCLKVPGVEISTGSLGHGLSIGVGVALAGKYLKKNFKVYVLLGDGEIQEGSIWEAAMSAGHYKLDNMVGIIDYNKLSADGITNEIMRIEPLVKKWESFGWAVVEINGHNISEIFCALKNTPILKQKPTMIIAHTIKGKGLSCAENKFEWHSKVPSLDQAELALKELR